MRNGRNPIRRNRNIGTSRQGHGQNNRMAIPGMRWVGDELLCFYERLTEFSETRRFVRRSEVLFYVERTRDDSAYAATVDDIAAVLKRIPAGDLKGLDKIVLRQPKRKEERLASVWGRLCYTVDIGKYTGPAIMLDAFPNDTTVWWPRRIKPDGRAEIDRLRADGHRIEEARRSYRFTPTLDEVRATQLYRTLPHEVGHWVDWRRRVEDVEASDDYGDLVERYDQIPLAEKEAFAHRYADEFRRRMFESGVFPFERILSRERLERDGLRISDFEYATD